MSNELERLSGDYIQGYTKAIQDMTQIIGYIREDLKHHGKSLTQKYLDKLLKCILENRGNIRDSIGNGFVRYNNQKDDFEYFMPDRGIKSKK